MTHDRALPDGLATARQQRAAQRLREEAVQRLAEHAGLAAFEVAQEGGVGRLHDQAFPVHAKQQKHLGHALENERQAPLTLPQSGFHAFANGDVGQDALHGHRLAAGVADDRLAMLAPHLRAVLAEAADIHGVGVNRLPVGRYGGKAAVLRMNDAVP